MLHLPKRRNTSPKLQQIITALKMDRFDGPAPMLLDGAGLAGQEAGAPYPHFQQQQQQQYHHQQCMVLQSPFEAAGGYCDSSQRSGASAGGGGRPSHPTSPDSASALEGAPAALLMHHHQQLGYGGHQQQQQQQYSHQPMAHQMQYAGGDEMRAQIAQQIQMREKLLQRTHQLAAEVQRRQHHTSNNGHDAANQGHPPLDGDKSSALEAARQLKVLLSSLPADQRRAYATELLCRRQQLLAVGASGAGAADVGAAALEHCQMLLAGAWAPVAGGGDVSSRHGELALIASYNASANVVGGGSDDDGEAFLLPASARPPQALPDGERLMGDCGMMSSNSVDAAAAGGAAGGDTAASEVQRVVREMVAGTAVAMGCAGEGGGSPNGLLGQGGLLSGLEDRYSPNVRPAGGRAAGAAGAPAGAVGARFSGSSSNSPAYGGGPAAAAPGLPCPHLDDDAVKGLLMGDELGAVDAGLLDDFLDDFLGDDGAALLAGAAAGGPQGGGAATGAAVAAALDVQLMRQDASGLAAQGDGAAAAPPASHVSSSSAFGAVRAPSFSSWAVDGTVPQQAARQPSLVAIGDQHGPYHPNQQHQQHPAALAGGLSQYGMHAAHLEAAAHHHHHHQQARMAHGGWAGQCSVHAVRSSAPGHIQAATPFARAENQPSGFVGESACPL
jgi:hypothetical protein